MTTLRRLAALEADRVLEWIMIAALVLAIGAAVGGCARDVPLFVTTTAPALPPECEPGNPAVRTVKPDLPGGWASDAAAVRDREAWRTAYRDAQGQRVTCWRRLQVLFPQPSAPVAAARPTS